MNDQEFVQCMCGRRIWRDPVKSFGEEAVCPDCGAKLTALAYPCSLSAADTQMINISDMAKMAQDGVDVSTTGEWDTRNPAVSKSDKDDTEGAGD